MKMALFKSPPVQFESKVKYNKLKNEIIEANFMNMIEQEYNSAQQYEQQEIMNNYYKGQGDFLYINDPQLNHQNREILQDINLQQENWEEFQHLGLAESTRDSQIDLNYENYFANQKEQEKQRQLQEEQNRNMKTSQKQNNNNHIKYPPFKKQVNTQYSVNEIPENTSKSNYSGTNSINNSKKVSSKSFLTGELTPKNSTSTISNKAKKQSNNSSINNLRNSNSTSQQVLSPQSQSNLQQQQQQRDNDEANNLDRKQMLQIVKDKVLQLSRIPEDQWSENDKKFMQGALQLSAFNDEQDELSENSFQKSQDKLPPYSQSGQKGNLSSNSKYKSDRLSQNSRISESSNSSKRSITQPTQQQKQKEIDPMLLNVKKKWEQIKDVPQQMWTQSDYQFMEIVQANNMQKVFAEVDE